MITNTTTMNTTTDDHTNSKRKSAFTLVSLYFVGLIVFGSFEAYYYKVYANYNRSFDKIGNIRHWILAAAVCNIVSGVLSLFGSYYHVKTDNDEDSNKAHISPNRVTSLTPRRLRVTTLTHCFHLGNFIITCWAVSVYYNMSTESDDYLRNNGPILRHFITAHFILWWCHIAIIILSMCCCLCVSTICYTAKPNNKLSGV